MTWALRTAARRGAVGYVATLCALVTSVVSALAVLLYTKILPVAANYSATAQNDVFAVSVGVLAVTTVVCWTLVELRPAQGPGLCCAAVASYLPLLARWSDLPVSVRALLLAAPPVAIGALAVAVVGWSRISVRGRIPAWIALALGGSATAVLAAGYDPFRDPACSQVCAPVSTLITGLSMPDLLAAVAGLSLVAAITGTVAIWFVPALPVLVRSAVPLALFLLAGAAAVPWLRWGSSAPSVADDLLRDSAFVSVSLAVLVTNAQLRRARRDLTRMLTNLDTTGALAAGKVRCVHFAVPGEQRWIDVRGGPAPNDAQPSVIVPGDGDNMRLVLTRRRGAEEVLAALTPASRLALENSRLDALNRLRVDEVRSSQRRIVTTSDIERRRLERDLHDGVQQRLVSAAMHLRLAMSRVEPSRAARLLVAENQLRRALDALRAVAHGTFPTDLAEEGLATAVEDLAACAPLPVRLDLEVNMRLPAETEMTAYLAIAAALGEFARLKGTTQVAVQLRVGARYAALSVTGDGRGEIVMPAAVGDRVGAMGGDVRVARTPDGESIVEVMLPCGS